MAAELEEPNGYIRLGHNYAYGLGVPQDYKKASEFFLAAGKLGDGRGYTELGIIYAEGRGVAKDIKQANAYFLKASELGESKAIYLMKSLK